MAGRRIAALGLTLAALTAASAPAQITSESLEAPDGMAPAPEPEFKRPFRPIGPTKPDAIPDIDTQDRPGARLRRLDKMTGAQETFDLATGGSAEIGRLRLTLRRCLAPEEATPRGTKAFLDIVDLRHPQAEPAFHGWMFADSPALSALDHPRYDVWVISCTTSAPEASSGNE